MSFYALSALINAVISTFVGIFVFSRNRRDPRYLTHSFFSAAVAIWSFFYFIWQITPYENIALFACRSLMAGAIFIPICYLHHLFILFDIYEQKKQIIKYGYLGGLVFLALDFTPLYVKSVGPKMVFKYWPDAGVTYLPFLALWFSYVLYGVFIIIKQYRKSSGAKRNQIMYVLLATFIGWSGGATNFPLWFNIPILPLGNILVSGYMLLLTYAIVRYRLMDINVALTRAGIFAIVYTFVLGIPFVLGYKYGLWQIATWIMLLLATLGPFIYTKLRRHAEDRLLREEHHAHQLLMQASSGMTQERDLRRLLNLIVHLVPRIMKLKNTSIYLLNKESTQFTLETIRYKNNPQIVSSLEVADPLIEYLKAKRAPLVYEEMKSYPSDKNSSLPEILSQMRNMSASVILPCFAEDTLLGFLILDDKKSDRMYTLEDLNVLSTLTNQAALAIENARFYESDKENQALLYQSATLADMGVMADSMGHQIKNHIQKMMAEAGAQAGITEELLKQDIEKDKAVNLLKRLTGTLHSIENQGEAGGRLIESISKFSRLPKASFKEITLKEILDTANEILRFKVKFDEIDYNVNIPDTLPILYAHPILSEAFVNLINNAYDAIIEKEDELEKTAQAVPYRGEITITATQKNDSLEIKVHDNGIGIKKDGLSHLFLPFYTTKATSLKGTGLGLFVIKKIVSNHKGKIGIDSEYMQGTTFTILLPIRQERKEDKSKEGKVN